MPREPRANGARRAAGVIAMAIVLVAPAGKLDLKLKEPKVGVGIEGYWKYRPIGGAEPYTIHIVASPGGFYEYQGVRDGEKRPVLQFDTAQDGAKYRGEIGEGFDPCIAAGARFSIAIVGDQVTIEPTLPVATSFTPLPPGPCRDATKFSVQARGRDEFVPLKPVADLAGAPGPEPPPTPSTGTGYRSEGSRSDTRNSEANTAVTLGGEATLLPDGTSVEVLGSLRDARERLWHHVKVVGPWPVAAPEGASGEASGAAAEGTEAHGEGTPAARPASGSGAAGAASQDKDARQRKEKETDASSGGAAARTSRTRRGSEGPPSGYVAAASVVMRWDCELERVGSAAEAPAARGAGKP